MSATRLVCDAFLSRHPVAAARLLEKHSARQLAELFARAGSRSAAATLAHMGADRAADCLAVMKTSSAVELLAAMRSDVQLAILRVSRNEIRDGLLEALDDQLSDPLRRMLRYPEGTVGELMDAFVFSVPDDITVQETLKRARAASLEMPFYVYVLDRKQKLVGVASLKKLIRGKRSDPVTSVMSDDVVALNPAAPQAEMIKSPHWRSFHTLPVTEDDGTFLGVVRYQTISRLREELTPDSDKENIVDTALALGELYWVGLAGVMDGIAGRARETGEARNTKPEE